jgi:uncharacterized protein YbjT (DUF2867 family)
MKIVAIGFTGLNGSRLVKKLSEHGHHAVATVPNTGVNSITGERLADALKGAWAVVGVTNFPSSQRRAVVSPAHSFAFSCTCGCIKACFSRVARRQEQ